MNFKHKNTLCTQINRKILIFEEFRAIFIFKGLTVKKGAKFDDAIEGHARGAKFEIFSSSRMSSSNFDTYSKEKNNFLPFYFKMEIAFGYNVPTPKANRVNCR